MYAKDEVEKAEFDIVFCHLCSLIIDYIRCLSTNIEFSNFSCIYYNVLYIQSKM